jgi:hypothetical protein
LHRIFGVLECAQKYWRSSALIGGEMLSAEQLKQAIEMLSGQLAIPETELNIRF